MQVEDIKALLAEEVSEFGYESLEEMLATFADGEREAGYHIADAIAAVVEEITGRRCLWHYEILQDDFKLSDQFLFIVVDPETKVCLTADNRYIGVLFTIDSEEDVVHAVEELAKIVRKEG